MSVYIFHRVHLYIPVCSAASSSSHWSAAHLSPPLPPVDSPAHPALPPAPVSDWPTWPSSPLPPQTALPPPAAGQPAPPSPPTARMWQREEKEEWGTRHWFIAEGWTGSRRRWGFVYLSMFPVQLCVVLLCLAEIVLGLLELGFPDLDLLVLPGHLQQGLHLVGTEQGKTWKKSLHTVASLSAIYEWCFQLMLFFRFNYTYRDVCCSCFHLLLVNSLPLMVFGCVWLLYIVAENKCQRSIWRMSPFLHPLWFYFQHWADFIFLSFVKDLKTYRFYCQVWYLIQGLCLR